MAEDWITYTDAARKLGIDRRTMPYIVDALRLRVADHPFLNKGKALTAAQFAEIREFLNRPKAAAR